MSSQNKAKRNAIVKAQVTAIHKKGGSVPRTQQVKFKYNHKRKENRVSVPTNIGGPISKSALILQYAA